MAAYCIRSQTGCPVHTERPYVFCPICQGEAAAFEVPACGEELASGQLRVATRRFEEGLPKES